jgi:hypothetical protein
MTALLAVFAVYLLWDVLENALLLLLLAAGLLYLFG